MKKLSFCFLVLLAGFILALPSSGQNRQGDSVTFKGDSVKTDLNLSAEVIQKLDSKDIVEIIKYREKLAQEKEIANAKMKLTAQEGDYTDFVLLVLIGIFLLALFVVPYYVNLKKAKGRQQIILNLIEKDKDIPDNLFANPRKPQKSTVSDLHKGILLIAFGLSISVVIFVLRIQSNFWTIGLIPVFIGIGYIISFRLSPSLKSKSETD